MKNKNINNAKNNNVDTLEHSDNIINNQNGGFLSSIFGSEASRYTTKICLDAFKANMPHICLFIVKHTFENGLLLDFGKKDNEGRTLIHWMVGFSAKNSEAKKLLIDILNTPGIADAINKQDNLGNTAIHTTLYVAEQNNVNMDDVITLLVKKGADLSIENKEGKKVVLDEISDNVEDAVEDKKKSGINILVKKSKKNKKNVNTEAEIEDVIKKITNQFVVNTDRESETIGFNRNSLEQSSDKKIMFGGAEDTINSSQLINELLQTFNTNQSLAKTTKSLENQSNNLIGGQMGMRKKLSYNSESNLSSSSFSNSSKSSISQKNTKFYDAVVKIGGAHESSSELSLSSMSSLQETPKRKYSARFSETSNLNSQTGSAKSSSSSSFTTSSSSGDDAEKSSSSSTTSDEDIYSSEGGMDVDEVLEEYGLKKLGRFKNEESTKRHEETIKRIIKNLSVDELMARVYKAMLWKNIKDSKKELNNDELSIELEKQSSDKKLLESFVKGLDKNEVEKLKQIISEKQKENKGEKKDSKAKKDNKKLSRFLQEMSEELDNTETDSDAYTSD